jgi:hypothetical protein
MQIEENFQYRFTISGTRVPRLLQLKETHLPTKCSNKEIYKGKNISNRFYQH